MNKHFCSNLDRFFSLFKLINFLLIFLLFFYPICLCRRIFGKTCAYLCTICICFPARVELWVLGFFCFTTTCVPSDVIFISKVGSFGIIIIIHRERSDHYVLYVIIIIISTSIGLKKVWKA